MPISKKRQAARLRAFYQKPGPKPKLRPRRGTKSSRTRKSRYDGVDDDVIQIALRSLMLGVCTTPNEAVRKAVDAVRVFGNVRLPDLKVRGIKDWQKLISGKPGVDYTENEVVTLYENWGLSVPMSLGADGSGETNLYPNADFGGRTKATNVHVRRIIQRMKRKNLI